MALSNGNGICVSPADVHTDPTSESDARTGDLMEGYIALHFPDGVYYVNESSVVLGRDVRLQEFLEKHTDIRVTRSHPTYQPPTREEHEKSVVERTAHVVGSDDDSPDEDDIEPTEPRYASLEGGIATFDINLQQTSVSQDDFFLPIHPPGDPETGRFPRITAISKQHLRIYANDDDDCWMLEVLGRNGAFINDRYYEVGSHVPLDHMAKIGVADLDFRVAYEDISDSELEDDQGDSSDEGEMASSVDESETTPEEISPTRYRKGMRASASSEESDENEVEEDVQRAVPKIPKPTTKLKLKVPMKTSDKTVRDDKQPKTPKDKPSKRSKETSEEAQKKIMSLLQPGEEPGRRKGPGRPPANGLMSKREMRERQKAMVDAQKREKEGSSGSIASPTADISASDIKADPDDKANSKKRKRSATTGDPKADSADRKKRPTPEKSPELTEDQFTHEQLQPPGLTYVVIIYRILQDLAPQQLNLQQLYKEMKKRYPYYRFRPKPGWESSVRHTVSAHNFIKGEKDGKGYKYTFNPEEPPAPQKQKQVTAPSQPPYPNFGGRPAPGQYPPTNYPYTYGNAYQQGPTQPSIYGHNLPLHNQRPLANGITQPGHYQQTTNPGGQAPPTRNPQNSPYPINPTVPGLTPNRQAALGTTGQTNQQNTVQNSIATTQTPLANQPPRPATGVPQTTQSTQPSQSQPQQAPGKPPLQTQTQGINQQQQQTQPASRSNGPTSQPPTPAQTNGISKPPASPITPQQPSSATQPSRPTSQPSPTAASSTTAKPPHPPTASEELIAGRIPAALVSFEANMKRLASNMPQRQQDMETRALDQAMLWIRENPNREFAPEPGMSTYTVSVISNMKTMIAKQDAEILRVRELGSVK